MGLQRLMKYDPDRFQCSAFAVISEEEMIPLCKKYGIDYLMYDNLPVGKKKNAGLDVVIKKDFDYLIELGSDDILCNKLLDYYEPLMKSGEDFFATKNIAFIDGVDGQARIWQYDPNLVQGLGRCMSKKLLTTMTGKIMVRAKTAIISDDNLLCENEKGFLNPNQVKELAEWVEIIPNEIGTFMWNNNINRGLDNDSTTRILGKGFTFKLVETPEPLMADIKSDENIWGYNPELGDDYDLEKFLSKLSQKEKAMFWQTQKKLKSRRIEKAIA